MDEVTWAALTAVLTALGAAWTFYAFRNRGAASGLRGAGLTLLPPAAFLTGTLEMFTEIGASVTDWATSLVLNPMTWAGIICAGLAVLLMGSSSALRERGRGGKPDRRSVGPAAEAPKQVKGGQRPKGEPVIDDDLDDIEALLKRRGIT